MRLDDLLKSSSNSPSAPPGRERSRAYVRVSHERSADKAISPETQKRLIEDYAVKNGYEIAEWYVDLARSAFRDDAQRVEFRRLIEDAKADPLTSVILVYRYDRFSRGDNASALQHDLLRHGVRVESTEEGYYDPDSETGAIMMPLTWSLNRLYSLKLSKIVTPNMKTNFEQRDPDTGWAYKNGGWAQWGYKTHRIYTGHGRKGSDLHKMIWVLDDLEVGGKPIWKWTRGMLIEWRLREHLGYDRIAARLTDAGVPTPSGRSAWSHTTIQSLLGEYSRLFQYAGYAFWYREDCRDRHNRKRRDPSEWIVVQNAHPAIISEKEAEAITSMTDNLKCPKSGRNGEASRFALSGGLLKCAICGANYAGTKQRSGDYYVCGSHLYRRGAGCGPAWFIPRDQIEAHIFGKILKQMVLDEDGFAAWVNEVNDTLDAEWRTYEKGAPERRQRILDCELRMKNLSQAIAIGGPEPTLLEDVRQARAEFGRLIQVDSLVKPPRLDVQQMRQYRDDVISAARSTDYPARARVLSELVDEIVVDSRTHALDGRLLDPRSIVCISMAAPTGVEPVLRP